MIEEVAADEADEEEESSSSAPSGLTEAEVSRKVEEMVKYELSRHRLADEIGIDSDGLESSPDVHGEQSFGALEDLATPSSPVRADFPIVAKESFHSPEEREDKEETESMPELVPHMPEFFNPPVQESRGIRILTRSHTRGAAPDPPPGGPAARYEATKSGPPVTQLMPRV